MCDYKENCWDDLLDSFGIVYCALHGVQGYENVMCFNCPDDTDDEVDDEVDQLMAAAYQENARRDKAR